MDDSYDGTVIFTAILQFAWMLLVLRHYSVPPDLKIPKEKKVRAYTMIWGGIFFLFFMEVFFIEQLFAIYVYALLIMIFLRGTIEGLFGGSGRRRR